MDHVTAARLVTAVVTGLLGGLCIVAWQIKAPEPLKGLLGALLFDAVICLITVVTLNLLVGLGSFVVGIALVWLVTR